jgi:2-succinyl-6-hydroxy-2,4-cyclohexadiene-1-carboxylate synthase
MPTLSIDAVRYNVVVHGSGDPLVLLHGFTGSSHSWRPLAAHLAGSFRVVAIDLIGHGLTDAPADLAPYHFPRALHDLAALTRKLDLTPASWLGYSMGGRIALGLAIQHPDCVSALILESASPGIADPDERAARQRADAELADRIERDGIPAFVDHWERLPMWSTQANLPPEVMARQREIRLGNRAAGLAGSLRGMGSGAQPSLWDRLGALRCPVLLVAGERDAKFATIAARMAAAIPSAELALIADTGHAVHLERPDLFLSCVCRFLASSQAAADAARKERHDGK